MSDTRRIAGEQGICGGCEQTTWLVPLHGERGGPLRCFMCAGAWNAEHTRRRKWGRIVIKAMRLFLKEGGRHSDLDKLKGEAVIDGALGLRVMPGYERADNIGADVPDVTSELLVDLLQLVHPDYHPPERQELAKRVTQELLDLRPFVFPAPKPEPPEPPEPDEPEKPTKRADEQSRDEDEPGEPIYPCELCSDTAPYFYCDPCRAEYDRREHEKAERERAKRREQYARRPKMWTPPRDKRPKSTNLRQAKVAVNRVPNTNSINRDLSGLQAAILKTAYRKRMPDTHCDVSHPELLAEIWGWKPNVDLRWTAEDVAERDSYRVGDPRAASDTHGCFNHIPAFERRRARASLSRALSRLESRMMIAFVAGTWGTYGAGITLTRSGEEIARSLA